MRAYQQGAVTSNAVTSQSSYTQSENIDLAGPATAGPDDLNMLERVLHLTQGHRIVSYVITESIASA